jgi:hypothetical protein
MIKNIFDLNKKFFEYYHCEEFRKFQNQLAEIMYASLFKSYGDKDNEVRTVENLCQSINGKNYDKLSVLSEKIHGKKSSVRFNVQNKQTCKELSDMVVISLISEEKEIIYEKTAFIQNKKESSADVWDIDQEQLYLLHNFPTFIGGAGIFNQEPFKDKEIAFNNSSKTLGNYGLFQSPGEMILISASEVYLKQNNPEITHSDIVKGYTYQGGNITDVPHLAVGAEIVVMYMQDGTSLRLPFLQNSAFSLNLYEFARNLTLFNIGEPVKVFDCQPFDKNLSLFNHLLLKKTGICEKLGITMPEDIGDPKFEDDVTVLVTHLALDTSDREKK